MHAAKPTARSVLGRVKASYPRLQRLLVPLDFSGKSRQALRYAVPLAEKFSARIHLVHVLPPAGKAAPGAAARRQKEALARLDTMSADLLPPKVRAVNLALAGEPAGQILAAAGRLNIDLIVLTTKSRSGLRRVLLGSTAEQVMRQAGCPVMSIRRH